MQFWIFRLFFLSFTVSGFAQLEYHEEQIKFYQGLPSDIVLKTGSDADGFLYVATPRGLSRYDGYEFQQHRQTKSGISDFIIQDKSVIFHDSGNGLARSAGIYAPVRKIIGNNYLDENPDNDHFDNLFIDSGNRIWSSDFTSVKFIAPMASKLKSFEYFKSNRQLHKVSFIETQKGKIFIFTANGSFLWESEAGKLKVHPNAVLAKFSSAAAWKASAKQLVIAGLNQQMFLYDPFEGGLLKLPAAPEPILGFAAHNLGICLAYSRESIYLLNHYKIWEKLYSVKNATLNHVNFDIKNRLIWASTSKGLIKLRPLTGISNYKFPAMTEASGKIISIAQTPDQTLWLLDSKNSIWSMKPGNDWQRVELSTIAQNLTSLLVVNNSLLIGSDKGVYKLQDNKMIALDLPKFFKGSHLKKMLITRNNELWLLFDKKEILRYAWPGLQKIEIPFQNPADFWTQNTWNDLYQDASGKIWLCGWAPKAYGIDFYDAKSNKFVEISELAQNANRDKFFGDYVNRIAPGSNGNLLFSGYGGFCIVAPNGNILKKIDTHEYPIANGQIEGICSDSKGRVIFATGDGLHIYDPVSGDILRISQADGLASDDLVYGFQKLDNETIALGTDSGISIVRLNEVMKSGNSRKLHVSSIRVDGRLRTEIPEIIELSKDENDVTIHFSDLSFQDKNKVFFRYKFTDESRWNSLGNSPELQLHHLPAGNYEIEIGTANALKQWYKSGLKLQLVAHPPFYKSWWFYVLCVLILLIAIIGIYTYLLRRQRKEARFRQQIREAEMQTLRAQMNPHFMFNTLNSINSYIIQNQTDSASQYLTTFSKLMRNILEYSKQEFITLEQELQALKLYIELESMRLEHAFDYTIKIGPELRKNDLVKIPPLIVQPFVENAIWHGLLHKASAGNLIVSARLEDEGTLLITVEDDGIGRKRASEIKKNHQKSFGIDITKQRLSLLHAENTIEISDLENPDGSPKGTLVAITLKI